MQHHYDEAFRTAIGDGGLPELPTLPGQKKGQQQQVARGPSSVAKGGNENFPTIEERAPYEKLDEVPKIRQFRHEDDVDREIWQDEHDIPPTPRRQDPDESLGWEGHASSTPRQAPAEIRAAIVQAAKEAGQNPAYALAVADRESSFNPTAHASKSIFGLFQMSGDLRKRYGIGDSTDPLTQARGFMAFTGDLKNQMADRMGREPTDAETYMGHHFGGGRAARMISSGDPNTPVGDIFTPNELAQNPHIGRAGTAGALSRSITSDMARRLERHGASAPAAGGDLAQYGQPVSAEPGLDPTMPIADQWATALAQRMPTARPNPENWDRATATFPTSENVDDRRDEDPDTNVFRRLHRRIDENEIGHAVSPATMIASDFSNYGTPLGKELGLDNIASAPTRRAAPAMAPDVKPDVLGTFGRPMPDVRMPQNTYAEPIPNADRNAPYVAQEPKDVRQISPSATTSLKPLDEMAFRQWVKDKKVPFDPDAGTSDYDMRGFYQGTQQGDPRAVSRVNQNDGRMHFPDAWKTPQHKSFSADSEYAGPVAPEWTPEDKLISPGGRILLDEKAPQAGGFGDFGAPVPF